MPKILEAKNPKDPKDEVVKVSAFNGYQYQIIKHLEVG